MSESRICAAAMSGGVDSSAAAHLLRRDGYDVRGVKVFAYIIQYKALQASRRRALQTYVQ